MCVHALQRVRAGSDLVHIFSEELIISVTENEDIKICVDNYLAKFHLCLACLSDI